MPADPVSGILAVETAAAGGWAGLTLSRRATAAWGWTGRARRAIAGLVLASAAVGSTALDTGRLLGPAGALAWGGALTLAVLALGSSERRRHRVGRVLALSGLWLIPWLGADVFAGIGGEALLALVSASLLSAALAQGAQPRPNLRRSPHLSTWPRALGYALGALVLVLVHSPAPLAGLRLGVGVVALVVAHVAAVAAGQANLGLSVQLAEAEVEAWREGERRFRYLVDNAADLILVLGADGIIRYASANAYAWTGWPPEALVGQPVSALLTPDSTLAWERRWKEAQASEILRAKVDLRCRDGTCRTFEAAARRRGEGLGPPGFKGLVVHLRDITEQEAEHARLVQSQARVLAAQRMARIGYWDYDYRHRVLTWPAETYRLFGLDPAQAPPDLAAWFRNAVPEQDRFRIRAALRRAVRDGVPYAVEHRLVLPDGQVRTVESRAELIRDGDGTVLGLVGVVHDVTERAEREAAVQRARNLEALGRLAAGIAHDFNNQLAAILGNLALAEAYLAQAPDRVPGFLAAADAAGQRARELANRLMAFARGHPLAPRPTDINQLVAKAVADLAPPSAIAVHHHPEPHLWPALVDAEQVAQLLAELLTNAVEALEAGGAIRVTTANHPARDGEGPPGVTVTVEDDGPGIAPENLARIFDPYFTTKPRRQGLGLATAEAIARRHGGFLTVTSEPGRHTRFTVWLPASPRPLARPDAPSPLPPLRVLVMDDEAAVREVAGAFLQLLGCTPTLTADGSEAVERYQAAWRAGAPFDLCLLDWTVPTGFGAQATLEALQRFDPHVRAVVMSGYADIEWERYEALGFLDFLPKPYQLEELRAVLARVPVPTAR
ncbi:MAG: PAS domain S-box protein [Firmicutes bacterium]|nr:PAS domain S-box protein [Alicyclobacillaceae bacterium]MCL6497261.1 PAS domain S-box protein [Bacillota bacterium]